MCVFLSWIEKGGKVYFLTPNQIFNTPAGEILRKQIGSEKVEDYFGHEAIRKYYGDFVNGVEKECSDFFDPANFPNVISTSIKKGEFKGYPFPMGLVNKPLDDKYWADCKPLDDKYRADLKSLADKYWADLKSLSEKHSADLKSLAEKHWELFLIPKNRSTNWR